MQNACSHTPTLLVRTLNTRTLRVAAGVKNHRWENASPYSCFHCRWRLSTRLLVKKVQSTDGRKGWLEKNRQCDLIAGDSTSVPPHSYEANGGHRGGDAKYARGFSMLYMGHLFAVSIWGDNAELHVFSFNTVDVEGCSLQVLQIYDRDDARWRPVTYEQITYCAWGGIRHGGTVEAHCEFCNPVQGKNTGHLK